MHGKCIPLWFQITAIIWTQFLYLGLFRYETFIIVHITMFELTEKLFHISVKVKEQFELNLSEIDIWPSINTLSLDSEPQTPAARQELVAVWRSYIHLMDDIKNVNESLGKDGKFQLFICLSLRYLFEIFMFTNFIIIAIL